MLAADSVSSQLPGPATMLAACSLLLWLSTVKDSALHHHKPKLLLVIVFFCFCFCFIITATDGQLIPAWQDSSPRFPGAALPPAICEVLCGVLLLAHIRFSLFAPSASQGAGSYQTCSLPVSHPQVALTLFTHNRPTLSLSMADCSSNPHKVNILKLVSDFQVCIPA